MRASASSLAAATGSKAGTEEYSTSLVGETRSSRSTSLLARRSASASSAAASISPGSPLSRAARNAGFAVTTGERSRMRCTPVSTIFLHSARLPVRVVRSSWSRSPCSRRFAATTKPATIAAMKRMTMMPMRALRPTGRYSCTTCAMRSRLSGGYTSRSRATDMRMSSANRASEATGRSSARSPSTRMRSAWAPASLPTK